MTTDEHSIAAAGHVLERARWAARSFATYSAADVDRIVRAVAAAAESQAQHYAEWAVRETGFGVVADKARKNIACSRGLVDTYSVADFVQPRIDPDARIVEIPRPAGVVLALTPSTNPVATVYFKVLLALMTRNAVVVSPHPMAKECCYDATLVLARAAVEAGAPEGIVQGIAEPTIPLVEALMADDRTNLILATGGVGVVRAAYSSGNPAIGVGPGNVPVLVDATADLPAAARRIVASKAFDNSVLCTNESVLIVEASIADRLTRELERAGAAILSDEDALRLAGFMFPLRRLNVEVIGKDATWIAEQAGIRVSPKTKVLIAPFDAAISEEPFTHEKLSPVLGMVTVPDAETGIATARSIIRIAGAGHSAAIHSTDERTIMRYAADVPVLRVAVNVGNSTGSSGIDTNLALSMTIGTGFVGRSSLGENLQPKHLINWTRIAYDRESTVSLSGFTGIDPWPTHRGAVPAYPLASNDPSAARSVRTEAHLERLSRAAGDDTAALREQIRRLVVEELTNLRKG